MFNFSDFTFKRFVFRKEYAAASAESTQFYNIKQHPVEEDFIDQTNEKEKQHTKKLLSNKLCAK